MARCFVPVNVSTFAVSSVRSRRARPPHVGKGSDTGTEPCQERIRRWSRMSLARPGCRVRAPTPQRKQRGIVWDYNNSLA